MCDCTITHPACVDGRHLKERAMLLYSQYLDLYNQETELAGTGEWDEEGVTRIARHYWQYEEANQQFVRHVFGLAEKQ